MSDYGGGDFDPGTSGGGGDSGGGYDPSAAGQSGSFDPFGGSDGSGLGMGGYSPFGGSGFGGGSTGAPPPQTAIGSPSDPAALSAQQGAAAAPPKPQTPSRMDQLSEAIKSLVGGVQHAQPPSLQSLAQSAKQGMGWFTGQNGQSSSTPPSTPPSPGRDLSQIAGDLGFSAGPGSPGAPTGDISGAIPTWPALLHGLFGGGPSGGGTGDASTGPSGAAPTQAPTPSDQQLAPVDTGPPAAAPEDLSAAAASPAAPEPAAAPEPPAAPAAAPAPAPPAPAQVSPQLPPGAGNNSGQPGPGDQVTGSASSAAAAGQGGQYAPGGAQWQNTPAFALLDLLKGDFGSFMKDLMGQQGVPANQNYAGAARPTAYGSSPGVNRGAPAASRAGPGATAGITDPFSTTTPAQSPLPQAQAPAQPPAQPPAPPASPGVAPAPLGGATGSWQGPQAPQPPQAPQAAVAPQGGPAGTATANATANVPPSGSATAPARVSGQEAVNMGRGLPANGGGQVANDQEFDAYARQVGQIESGGNPLAVTGSNQGLYQFGRAERQEFGITNWRDPAQQYRALQRETTRNRAILQRTLGREPTPGELYFTHQQGAGGGPAMLRAAQTNPDTPAYQALSPFYHNPRTAMTAVHGNIPTGNPLRNVPVEQVTAGQFVQLWMQRFARGYQPPTYAQAE
jgi:hypothetical protein